MTNGVFVFNKATGIKSLWDFCDVDLESFSVGQVFQIKNSKTLVFGPAETDFKSNISKFSAFSVFKKFLGFFRSSFCPRKFWLRAGTSKIS